MTHFTDDDWVDVMAERAMKAPKRAPESSVKVGTLWIGKTTNRRCKVMSLHRNGDVVIAFVWDELTYIPFVHTEERFLANYKPI